MLFCGVLRATERRGEEARKRAAERKEETSEAVRRKEERSTEERREEQERSTEERRKGESGVGEENRGESKDKRSRVEKKGGEQKAENVNISVKSDNGTIFCTGSNAVSRETQSEPLTSVCEFLSTPAASTGFSWQQLKTVMFSVGLVITALTVTHCRG
ncbi:hypothetical protein GN956_G20688 [Arapaima gigas]